MYCSKLTCGEVMIEEDVLDWALRTTIVRSNFRVYVTRLGYFLLVKANGRLQAFILW